MEIPKSIIGKFWSIIDSSLNPSLARKINKLERIQQKAAKLVPELAQLPYETRLQHLNLCSLYCQRQTGDLIDVYKLVSHTRPIFTFVNSVTRGQDHRISKQHCRIIPRLNFFIMKRLVNQ